MAAIGKKLQTNEKLKRWLTHPNRNFNETNEPRSALTLQTRPPSELSKNSSTCKSKWSKQENTYVDKSRLTLTYLLKQKRNLKDETDLKINFQYTSQD